MINWEGFGRKQL